MAVEEKRLERTGFLNIRQVYDPRHAESNKAEILDHMRSRMRLQMGEKLMERLSDARRYVVRIWEGEKHPRPSSPFDNPFDYLNAKDTVDTELPQQDTGYPNYYGLLWATAVIVLQDYRDAEIGEYVHHTESREGASTVFIPYQVKALDREEFDVMRFGVVKFSLPDKTTMRVMQREL